MSAVYRWGDPGHAITLPDAVRTLLGSALGLAAPRPPAATIALAPGGLPEWAAKELRAVCAQVRTDDEARLAHAAGASTVDLLRLRSGEAPDAPDAVALPADHDEIVALLWTCAANRIAVVPFGGGTSVVGGL